MTEHAVIIVGGGPTGMTLAAELRLAGVDAVLLERRADAVIESTNRAACTRGPLRCSTSAASATASSRRGGPPR